MLKTIRSGGRRARGCPRVGAVGLAAVATLLLAAPGAATAQSGTLDASCTSQSTLTFSPGLTLMSQPTRFNGNGSYFGCVSPIVSGGTLTGTGGGILSCLGGNVDALVSVTWNLIAGGTASSTIRFNTLAVVGVAGGVSVVTEGTVTDGLFAGDQYLSSYVMGSGNLLKCALPGGMATASGAGQTFFSN